MLSESPCDYNHDSISQYLCKMIFGGNGGISIIHHVVRATKMVENRYNSVTIKNNFFQKNSYTIIIFM